MAYSSRTLIGDTTNGQRAYDQQNPTISKLVRPPDDRYTFSPQDDSRYRTDLIRTEDRYNESIRRPGEDPYSIKNIVNGNNRPNTNYESSKPIPTSHVVVDPIRRPAHGNARTGVVEINIAVSFGGNRNSQGSYVRSSTVAKPSPPIRSQAVIDDVGYIDINFQSPQKTAKLSTDGIIRNQSSQASVGFSNTNTNY
ncbi:unnamed protein product [Rotaria magnacalcarata]|uniref:Uncharacterized protein n=1 Tax=Rotaria magnacalcarata TaxID=392030 RepID=A0A819HLR4_9BILA|nr:unnamed protein product [Rotaria magnacalcarata]CAF2113849.1 unnamed protein product [Rotaria magnacalcarata]CAF3869541.1 unnamed protein product [Rotaria magnacalcarata]CAF3904108.1 unnamed protein product [Rotaria magnacalcarata]